MSTFKKLNTKIYQKAGVVTTPDYIYWKKLGEPVLVKEFGPIDYIDFSPVEPFHFAVTCSVRVQVYNPITKLVVKNISRFRENAHGAVFRPDGKLLCAGGDEGALKLFDVSTKSMLRLFKGHTHAIHRTQFVYSKPQIASFSDDKSVKIWDISTEQNVLTYSEHSDYVRAGTVNENVPDIILSGGYDNIVKMYDTRTDKAILTVNHESPIESLLFLPSGGVFLSAGGTSIKIWDALAGGKLLGTISQHHKTITCLRLGSDNKRLLSGSLDRHVKIYDISTFKVVHTLDYPNAILSLGISNDDQTVVTGLVDGLVCISRRKDKAPKDDEESNKPTKVYMKTQYSNADMVVPDTKLEKQSKHDMYLRKFQYSKALESALITYVANKHPEVTVSVLQELIRRKAFARVLKSADTKTIMQLLKFFTRYIADYRFTRALIFAVNIFVDVFQESIYTMPFEVTKLFCNLTQILNEEVKLVSELSRLQGAMQMILAASDKSETHTSDIKNLTPSVDAQKSIIFDVS
ncbi:utp15 u3 small nucleolar rna-associated protein 15 family member [Holotrichia oblita]|uniref:Utp15 u3 small nucleolar rna-associated protein 15 family member n=1 Tax=Holotrichia oblita TaxID=644536 RepID=A0ACB9T9I4_HOLOL|nr:utp15 u3 small nucleolar rna-associated protein 15 family member [Holotrichia oblita]